MNRREMLQGIGVVSVAAVLPTTKQATSEMYPGERLTVELDGKTFKAFDCSSWMMPIYTEEIRHAKYIFDGRATYWIATLDDVKYNVSENTVDFLWYWNIEEREKTKLRKAIVRHVHSYRDVAGNVVNILLLVVFAHEPVLSSMSQPLFNIAASTEIPQGKFGRATSSTHCGKVRAYLNGVDVSANCFDADDVAGYADLYVKDDNGKMLVENTDFVRVRKYGDVRIEWRNDSE